MTSTDLNRRLTLLDREYPCPKSKLDLKREALAMIRRGLLILDSLRRKA